MYPAFTWFLWTTPSNFRPVFLANSVSAAHPTSAPVCRAPDAQLSPLTRTQSKNAFSRAVFSRLVELLERAELSESVLAVVLTGANGYFTSGADVKEIRTDRESMRCCAIVAEEYPILFTRVVHGQSVRISRLRVARFSKYCRLVLNTLFLLRDNRSHKHGQGCAFARNVYSNTLGPPKQHLLGPRTPSKQFSSRCPDIFASSL